MNAVLASLLLDIEAKAQFLADHLKQQAADSNRLHERSSSRLTYQTPAPRDLASDTAIGTDLPYEGMAKLRNWVVQFTSRIFSR